MASLAAPERTELGRDVLKEAGATEVKLATEAEAKEDLASMKVRPERRATREIVPNTLARNLFLFLLAGALAMLISIWLFVRPL